MTQYLQTKTDLFAAAIAYQRPYQLAGAKAIGATATARFPWRTSILGPHLFVDQSPLSINADKIHTPTII